ncbi:MAG: site-2 protease family protein [Planctomycetota bacterium]|nr:site-2 protease family protein [Planctomycetota bacterium]
MMLLEPPRTQWDLKWRMCGVLVRVHPFFWLMALLLSYQENQPFPVTLTYIVCIFVSILVHEFGHAFCGQYYGCKADSVVLYHFGGLCIHRHSLPPRWPSIFMLLWGAGAGFVLGGLAFGLQWAMAHGYLGIRGNAYLDRALACLVWVNLVWGCVNFFPILPLDGGQVLREVVQWRAPRRGDRFVVTVSLYVALVASGLGIGLYIYDPTWGLYPAAFFGVLAYSSWHIRKQLGEYGNLSEEEEPRKPWEQDPDSWKRL